MLYCYNFTCIFAVSYILFARQVASMLVVLKSYQKSSYSSLLYIIQCFRFSSEDTSF